MNSNQIMPMLLVAGAVAVAVSVFIAPEERGPTPTRDPSAAVLRPTRNDGINPAPNAAVLRREDDGHYWAQAAVDGVKVDFLVDTGASIVALTFRDAQRLGLRPDRLDYRWSIRTAGGETFGASVTLGEIKIGNVKVENVDAMVMRDELEQSLLGMTFLGELYSYEFKGGQLIIRQ